jgi:hypothetical protein
MKILGQIFIFFLISGCSVDGHLVGKYASKDNSSFQFRSDHTFLNEYKEGEHVKYSSGTWTRVSEDTIVINSEIRTINIPLGLTFLDSSRANAIDLSIDLRIDKGLALANYRCYIFVNNKYYNDKSCDSISALHIKEPVYTLSLIFSKELHNSSKQFFPVNSDTLKFDKPLKRDIKLRATFDDIFFEYNPFNNEKIKTGKNSISLYNPYLKEWRTIPKLPNSAHVFWHWEE